MISGYSGEELLNMEVWQLAHPEFRELMQSRAEARRTGQRTAYPSGTIQDRNQERSDAMAGFQRGRDPVRGTVGDMATAFDITERKRGEQLQSALFRIANLAGEAEDLQQFYASIHQVVGELMYAKNFYIAVLDEVTT